MVSLFSDIRFKARSRPPARVVRSALQFLAPGMDVKRATVEEESGPVVILLGRLKGSTEAMAFWEAMVLEGVFEEVLDTLDQRVEGEGVVRLYFDAEEAWEGRMVLTHAGEGIDVECRLEEAPATIAETVDAARRALEYVRERKPGEAANHVVTAFLLNRGDVLVLRRSQDVGTYRGKWAGVSGYLEGDEPPLERALKEVSEELGLRELTLAQAGRPLVVVDGEKTWVVHPFALDADTRDVSLDWESAESKWVRPNELPSLDTVPGLAAAYARVSPPTPEPL